jgi:hypothetical protein
MVERRQHASSLLIKKIWNEYQGFGNFWENKSKEMCDTCNVCINEKLK